MKPRLGQKQMGMNDLKQSRAMGALEEYLSIFSSKRHTSKHHRKHFEKKTTVGLY
jgi:hypothetical protein